MYIDDPDAAAMKAEIRGIVSYPVPSHQNTRIKSTLAGDEEVSCSNDKGSSEWWTAWTDSTLSAEILQEPRVRGEERWLPFDIPSSSLRSEEGQGSAESLQC